MQLVPQQYTNLTHAYNFGSLQIGDYLVVYERFQHARVAASEYGRKHNMVFSCRMQPNGTMHVYRVNATQATVDRRGRVGKRAIPHKVDFPSKDEFITWLGTLQPGQHVNMVKEYEGMYPVMMAWCELYSLRTGRMISTYMQGMELVIQYVI